MVNIVLADDHHLVRQGLRALLEAETDFTVVGEASNGQEAIEQTRAHRPDILITDLMMPGISGIEVARLITQEEKAVKILLLSMYANNAYVAQAFQSGAQGYILKEASAETLVKAVRALLAGERYLCPPLTSQDIDAYIQQTRADQYDPLETLTERERETFQLAAQGLNSSEIASRLFISPRTVEVHRARLMRKLNLRTQSELIRYAIQRGVLSLPS